MLASSKSGQATLNEKRSGWPRK